ncbi:MAG: DUF3068 domain-containing protein [Micromonosporaceae bacterium]
MRRFFGFLLLAVGAFAVVLAVMLPAYAYPQLARLERGGEAVQSTAEGKDMTIFNPKSVTDEDAEIERTGVDVRVNRTVKGLTSAPEAKEHGDTMVWEVGMVILEPANPNAKNEPISVLEQKVCLDRRTGEAVEPCSSEYVKDPGRADDYKTFNGPHEGQIYKFPFGTEKKDYPYFDTVLRTAPAAKYVKEDTVNGLGVYVFEQRIPRTKIEDRELPGRLLGLPDQPSILAERYYENTRTLWVEPTTGSIVKGTEEISQIFEDPDSGETLTLLEGTITLTDDTIEMAVDRASTGADKLRLVTSTGPLTLGIGGAASIAIGIWLSVTGRPREEDLFPDE